MTGDFDDYIESLRKDSRILLTRIEKNSEQIREKVKKLRSQNSIVNRVTSHGDFCNTQNTTLQKKFSLWRLRNDSSGVGGILCPEYFHLNLNRTSKSAPNMSSGRVLLTSNRYAPECHPKTVYRKPVKGCYCCSEAIKVRTRPSNTQYKSVSCYCKSCFEAAPNSMKKNIRKSENYTSSSPPLSCETLRRLQKIDYTPKSQFLRNVQRKIPSIRNEYPELTKNRENDADLREIYLDDKQRKSWSSQNLKVSSENLLRSKESTKLLTNKEQAGTQVDTHKANEEIQIPSQKSLRPKVIKKTICSKKRNLEKRKNKSTSSRNIIYCCASCEQCKNIPEKLSEENDSDADKHAYPKYCTMAKQHSEQKPNECGDKEKELQDLRKFREQNYFDTHASSQTLQSSSDSGSLQQYMLNDRLFPEPVRKIRKEDLVVTMPACATKQRKRIHYFPRYIVHQEKNASNTNYKKKRCQSCPLTGHAIDLGTLKTATIPTNSLALKHQKRLPYLNSSEKLA